MENKYLDYLREELQPFFRDEIFDAQNRRNFLEFIQCENIRLGEYEGNMWVIRKLDLNNFIIYEEDQDENGARMAVHHAVAIQRNYLVDLLMELDLPQ